MTSLMVEILNQFSGSISNRSIFVMAVVGFVSFTILKVNSHQKITVTLDNDKRKMLTN